MAATPLVRLLRPEDVPSCMALKDEAGWNQTPQDWLDLLNAAPQGCFGVDIDGQLAATTTAVCYGSGLAWIGMVLTAGRFRRRGLASLLMRHTLGYLEGRVDWIKLDATDLGRPVYQHFGFQDECPVERWLRPGSPARDFAAQRRELPGGFACGRPGSKAAYFGPCQTESAGTARELLEWFLKSHPGEAVYWDLLPDNRAALELARSHGFSPARYLMRMARPGRPGVAPRPTAVAATYAIAGFEWG